MMLNNRNLFIDEWKCKDTVTLGTFDVIHSVKVHVLS